MHMNGSNTHSIIGSLDQIDDTIAKLQGYVDIGYSYVFTSHDIAESGDALVNKINYLSRTKEIAEASDNSEDFIAMMDEAFPDYDGTSFMEMSARRLFAD